jgi:hypothetical protein
VPQGHRRSHLGRIAISAASSAVAAIGPPLALAATAEIRRTEVAPGRMRGRLSEEDSIANGRVRRRSVCNFGRPRGSAKSKPPPARPPALHKSPADSSKPHLTAHAPPASASHPRARKRAVPHRNLVASRGREGVGEGNPAAESLVTHRRTTDKPFPPPAPPRAQRRSSCRPGKP